MRQEGGHRICVKKLPPILVIQLKRFDYNFERDAAVKFNDYFEFPRELDMEPYTVAGLARRENEAVDCEPEDLDDTIVRKYKPPHGAAHGNAHVAIWAGRKCEILPLRGGY